MKNKMLVLLLVGLMTGGYSMESYASSVSAVTKSELIEKGKKGKKRKRYRGYKKPRSKKILGIFKRRSSCDCPKH
ncbi:hypothetical protein [Telluribacter humicola]|uniref:hypothetical protein n=1 Tax=Telluribacter humicola TaxID=1720261 RepID=UPI001A96B4BE|nr:hypothetical protein [Telluribacter humicola]